MSSAAVWGHCDARAAPVAWVAVAGLCVSSWLRAPETVLECCRSICLLQVEENHEVFLQGEIGDTYYAVITGSVRILISGNSVGDISEGGSFGEVAVLGKDEAHQKRGASVIANEPTSLASLGRGPYIKASGGWFTSLRHVLKKPGSVRTSVDLNIMLTEFRELDFFKALYYDSLQRSVCVHMTMSEYAAKERVETTKKGQKFFNIVLRCLVGRRFLLTPLRYCRFTPESQAIQG